MMATRAKIVETFKQIPLVSRRTNFNIISQACCLGDSLQKCSKYSVPLNKIDAKLKIENTFERLLLNGWTILRLFHGNLVCFVLICFCSNKTFMLL